VHVSDGEQSGRPDLVEQLAKVSRGLDSAVRAHNEVIASCEGKILDTAQRMSDLGVAGGSELEAPQPASVSVRMSRVSSSADTF
jgi:hypothetical protein